ncbi:MAG: hypothetical protein AB1391_01980 [Candidatus Micrarchaeota archaeon]
MAEEKKKLEEQPHVDGFKIFAKLKTNLKDVDSKLRTISFMEVVSEKDCVNAAYIESRNIEKTPYLFALFKFRNDAMDIMYSIPPNIAPKKRKLDVVRYFLNVLTVLGSAYTIEQTAIYQLLDAALKEMNDFVGLDFNKLYINYDNLKKDYEDVSRRFKRLQQKVDILNNENYNLKTKNDELSLRIKQLETMSNDTLKEKLQEWIYEHENEINISDFSKFYKIPETRVEEMLNVLVKEGYVQPIQ